MINKTHFSYLVSISLTLVIIAGVAGGFYFYRQYRTSEEAINNPQLAVEKEVADVVQRVGKLMILPAGTPLIMTVSDAAGLAGQPFFVKAENGDQVLVYPDARKAILYRPKINIIVEVATVTLDEPTGSRSGSIASASGILSSSQRMINIAIRNGTNTIGVTGKLESELKAKMNNISVVEKDNTKTKGVEKTTVIDMTGKDSATAEQLAGLIGATVGSLPQGEPKPDVDFLIIIGMDRK